MAAPRYGCLVRVNGYTNLEGPSALKPVAVAARITIMPLLVEPNRSSSKAFSSTATRGIIPAMKREAFERLVADALDDLPADIQQRLDNVDVVVEDWPDAATLRRAGVRHPMQLLGFYHGVPRTRRTRSYGLVLPDKITIYRRPLEMRSRTAEEMRATVRRVVRHEIAHHFGIGDDRLREIGAY